MIFCSSLCANYLSKAMILCSSLKKYHPECITIICLVEEEIPREIGEFKYFDKIILAKDLGIENFYQYMFKHTIIEGATCVKGHLFQYLLDNYQDENKFIYLDPDVKVFSCLEELEALLEQEEIVITPHLTGYRKELSYIKHHEISVLQHGVYNLGFLGIRRGEESRKFINWWTSRLYKYCYDDKENGIFTDQKWIDLAPALFDVYILKHPGYNFAWWNYPTREVTGDNENYSVNDSKLRFMHFSHFDSGINMDTAKWVYPDDKHVIYPLLGEYADELRTLNEKYKLNKKEWSYARYSNNKLITKEEREYYRQGERILKSIKNPFVSENVICDVIDTKEYIEKLEQIRKSLNLNTEDELWKSFWLNISLLSSATSNHAKYVVWGCDKTGEITHNLINSLFPGHQIVGAVDKFKKGKFAGCEITLPENIKDLEYDYVIICSNGAKYEAVELFESMGQDFGNKYIYGYGVSAV